MLGNNKRSLLATHTYIHSTHPPGKRVPFRALVFEGLSVIIEMHILMHQQHTYIHTPWKINKEAPGTDECSLNKQSLLCPMRPTHPYSLSTGATKPFTTVHTYRNTHTHSHRHKTTVEYIENLVSCLITNHLNSAPQLNVIPPPPHLSPPNYKSESSFAIGSFKSLA